MERFINAGINILWMKSSTPRRYRGKWLKRALALAGAVAATIHFASPTLENRALMLFERGIPSLSYAAYNSVDELVSETETGDERQALVAAFVEYLNEQNQHYLTTGLESGWHSFVANAKYSQFRKLDSKLGLGLSEANFYELNELWKGIRTKNAEKGYMFFEFAGFSKDRKRTVYNATFGKITETDENQSVIFFEPIVRPYEQLARIAFGEAFNYNGSMNIDESLIRLEEKRLEQWHDALKKRENRNFEDALAEEAFTNLNQLARMNNTTFSEEFRQMKKRELILHELQHNETPNSEYPSCLKEISDAKYPADQSYSMQHCSLVYKPPFLTEEVKERFLKSDFEARKKIAEALFNSLAE